MKSFISWKKTGELLLFSLFIGAINIIFSKNPGFFKGFFNPYLFLSLVVASYYGKYYGFLSIIFSAFTILLPLPLMFTLFYQVELDIAYYQAFKNPWLITLALALIGVYVFGMIRDYYVGRVRASKDGIKKIAKEKGKLLREVRLLKEVNREIEERISRQQDSVTALYSRIQELYSLNKQKVLSSILEMVQRFSGATSASIWELNVEEKNLQLAASAGWQQEDMGRTVLPADRSIEGWVVRNNMMFSVKMLLQYENLRKMDSGRNLMTLPVYSGRKTWGVLNIEDMPFIKYNHHTEKLLLMISSLAAPALERAIEYEAVTKQAEVNIYTGLPQYTEFFTLLEKMLKRAVIEQGTLSVIIMELINFDSLVADFDRKSVFALMIELAGELRKLSHNKAIIFHYKDENQVVLICPNLDFDGTSLLSLETLGIINEREWRINDKAVDMDVVLGYAALGEKEMTGEKILQVAENILEMQKV